MALPQEDKIFRSSNAPRALSIPRTTQNSPHCDFGWEAPIIDFYDGWYVTNFAPLGQVLEHGAEEVMQKFVKENSQKKKSWPVLGPRKLRWIHIPANNMEWAERVIKWVSKSKKQERITSGTATKSQGYSIDEENPDDYIQDVDKEQPLCLRPEYWRDQQRGCIEHCANHPLYARHMVPFFAPVPSSLESATASKLDTKDNTEPKSKAPNSKSNPLTKSQKVNMVLFMPYLHWATSGHLLNERNALIKGLAKAFETPSYQRPSYEEISKLDISPKLKLMRAFLFPENDRCLHIRRTLDQFYYSTLPQALADERTTDQVVYRFAKKQCELKEAQKKQSQLKEIHKRKRGVKTMLNHQIRVNSKLSPSENSTEKDELFQTIEDILQEKNMSPKEDDDTKEPSWGPPKIMMVNQLWLWVIDGDTIVTSFPAKLKSDLDRFKEKNDNLKRHDNPRDNDHNKGDDLYDSTDIWKAVFREFRLGTEYGKRSQKSALDLAWTIANQAVSVFHKRNLHPHLQFIEMFEMEINEITFKQAEAFNTFSSNVQLAHNAHNIGKVLGSLESFQRTLFPVRQTKKWRERFQKFASRFEDRLRKNFLQYDSNYNYNYKPNRAQAPLPQEDPNRESTNRSFSDELSEEFHHFQQVLENAPGLSIATKDLEAAIVNLNTALPCINFSDSEKDIFDDGVESAMVALNSTFDLFNLAQDSLESKLVNFNSARRHLGDAYRNLVRSNISDKASLQIVRSGIKDAMASIEYAKNDIQYECDVKTFIKRMFWKLKERIEQAHTTSIMNADFHAFIQTSTKSLELYTDMIMDDLFDVTTETSLVQEIKDILDELDIINSIKRQQESVTGSFMRQMFSGVPKNKQKDFYDSTRLESHVHELRNTAEATYSALKDLLELKQSQASAIEARSASKDAKASAAQAEASTSLSAETVKQGWSIMVFTIVTIVFLPLSFFTGIFGMNAEEFVSGHHGIGFYSAIMYPISIVVIFFSLGLALNTEFRLLTTLVLREIFRISRLSKVWELRFRFGRSIMKAIERENARRGVGSAHRKWEAGL